MEPVGPAERPPARVTRRRAHTRARLLDAAFAVFAAKGFGRVTIEEVCEAAGFSRGAFYSNFATLDELFFALYQERADLIAGQVADALAQDGPDLDVPASVDRVTEVLLLDVDWPPSSTHTTPGSAALPASSGASSRTTAPVARKHTSCSHSANAARTASLTGPSYTRVRSGHAAASRSRAAAPAAVAEIRPITGQLLH